MSPEIFGAIASHCPDYGRELKILRSVSGSALSVLITGESGTGKELVAHAVHEQSGRTGPFVAVNCAALPQNLVESELFGHVRGAFSGAERNRDGALVASNGGTLFLDEVGDAPAFVQLALLRALESKCVKPVGGETERPVDLRVIAATSRNTEEMMADGTFRIDLFYRLAGHVVRVPALRERRCDLAPLSVELCEHLGHTAGLSSVVQARIVASRWPGNVRQLRHALERAIACTAPGLPLSEIETDAGTPHPSSSIRQRTPDVFDPETARLAELWRSTGTLLLPVGLSRRGERSFERHVLLVLLDQHVLHSLPAAIRRRAMRLFAAGWQQSEGGHALRRLTGLLEGRLSSREIVELVQGALR